MTKRISPWKSLVVSTFLLIGMNSIGQTNYVTPPTFVEARCVDGEQLPNKLTSILASGRTSQCIFQYRYDIDYKSYSLEYVAGKVTLSYLYKEENGEQIGKEIIWEKKTGSLSGAVTETFYKDNTLISNVLLSLKTNYVVNSVPDRPLEIDENFDRMQFKYTFMKIDLTFHFSNNLEFKRQLILPVRYL
jgi:hypothetical protein